MEPGELREQVELRPRRDVQYVHRHECRGSHGALGYKYESYKFLGAPDWFQQPAQVQNPQHVNHHQNQIHLVETAGHDVP